jgi:hypothetical protein
MDGQQPAKDDLPIYHLYILAKTFVKLYRIGVYTVGELVALSNAELYSRIEAQYGTIPMQPLINDIDTNLAEVGRERVK